MRAFLKEEVVKGIKCCGSLCEAVYLNPSDPFACSTCMERVDLCLSEKGKGQKRVLCEVICVNSLFLW